MEPIVVALIGAGAGLATVVLGTLANRRLGLGQPIEEKINGRLKVLNDALEAEVAVRKQTADDCFAKLAEAIEDVTSLNGRLDELEARNMRLLDRLGMSMEGQAHDAREEKAGR